MTATDKIYFVSLGLMLLGLFYVLKLGLLPALLAGLLIYQLVDFGTRMLARVGVKPFIGKVILVLCVAVLVVASFGAIMAMFASYVSEGPESVVVLLQRMADVVDTGKTYLPEWSQIYLPANIEEWQEASSDWLRENARHLGIAGQEAGLFVLHIIIGLIIGSMVALNPGFQKSKGPLAQAFNQRVHFIGGAFRRIVFSQIRISALNTFLTAIFLAIVLPMFGHALPLTKTMIAVTFFAGLLPIIGNLISNTVIFLIALSVSPMVAVAALVFLIVIHKLEYFINAHIIGTQIRARAWELLMAMIVMEAAFGVAGLVAAPIYYAYIKDELTARKLV